MARMSLFFSFFFLAYLSKSLADLISSQTPVQDQDATDSKPRMQLKRMVYPKPYPYRPYALRPRKYPGYSYNGGRFYPAYNNYNASSYPVQADTYTENYDDSSTNYDNSDSENSDSSYNSNSNYGGNGNYNYNSRQGNNYYSRQGYKNPYSNYNNNNYNSYGTNRQNYNNNNNNYNNNNYNDQQEQGQYSDDSEYPENSYNSDTTGYDQETTYENNYNQDPAYSEDDTYAAAQDDGYTDGYSSDSSDSGDYSITVPNGEVRTFGDKQYGLYDNDPSSKLAEIERLASDLKYQGYYSSNSNYNKRDVYDDYLTTWKYTAGEYCNLRVIFLHFYKQTQTPSSVYSYGTTTYNTADINGAYYGSTDNYPDCSKQYLLLDDGSKTVQYCGHEAIPPGFRTLSSYITIKHYSAFSYNKRWEFLGMVTCT